MSWAVFWAFWHVRSKAEMPHKHTYLAHIHLIKKDIKENKPIREE